MVLVAVLGFAVAPALTVGPLPGPSAVAGGSPSAAPFPGAPAGASEVRPAILGVGQVTISAGGVSSNPLIVFVSGSFATVTQDFAGFITDDFDNSTLDGAGHTVDATGYPGAPAAVEVTGDGITVLDIVTLSTGTVDGILVDADVTSATVMNSDVTLTAGSTTAVGIQAGDVFPPTSVEPIGTYTITGNTVTGPGDLGMPGEEGILVWGASVVIMENTVTDFPLESTTTVSGNTYSSWFEDWQSVGIFAGCAPLAPACTIASNEVDDSSIGIVYGMMTSGFQGITPAPATITWNTVTDSLAYGLLAEATNSIGVTTLLGNLFDNGGTGAPGAYLLGGTFSLTNNVFVGTSAAGSNGAWQGQDNCSANYPANKMFTASVEVSDACNPATVATLDGNVFLNTTLYWQGNFANAGSSVSGGELVVFSETGLPALTAWSVTMAGMLGTAYAANDIVFNEPNGSHAYVLHHLTGWGQATLAYSGTITVAGAELDASTIEFFVVGAGEVVITSEGGSSNTSVVSTSGTTATVLMDFAGNITDFWADSTLDGAGHSIDATAYADDADVIGLMANGITVQNVHTVSGGSTSGILARASVTLATVETSTVELVWGSTTAEGIQLGNVFPTVAIEPSGTFDVNNNTVIGPGLGGEAGAVGILVWGATVSVVNNFVEGFSSQTTSEQSGNTYTSWFENWQSIGVMVGCADVSVSCEIASNWIEGNSIGLAYAMYDESFQGIVAGPVVIEGNTFSSSLGWGLLAEGVGASGTITISDNVFNNSGTGAPGAYLMGGTFDVTGNVFIGTSSSGSNGAWQGQDACSASYPLNNIYTASVEVTDACNPTTQATLNANVFESTSLYWRGNFSDPESFVSGGELVTFTEHGLPIDMVWSVGLNGTPGSAYAGGSIVGQLQNGSSSFTVARVSGYGANPGSGPLDVSGAPLAVDVAFVPYAYEVTFQESGLPAGTTWWAVLNGTNLSSTSTTIVFDMPNGSFSYWIGHTVGYGARPATGTVVVAAASVTVPVRFSSLATLVLKATGLGAGTLWGVTIDGIAKSATMPPGGAKSAVTFQVPVGTVHFVTNPPTGYGLAKVTGVGKPTFSDVNVTGLGKTGTTKVVLHFGLMKWVIFQTYVRGKWTGMPVSSTWSVTLHPHGQGMNMTELTKSNTTGPTGGEITFLLPKGAHYKFEVTCPPGYYAGPYNGAVSVGGHTLVKKVKFKPVGPLLSPELEALTVENGLQTTTMAAHLASRTVT